MMAATARLAHITPSGIVRIEASVVGFPPIVYSVPSPDLFGMCCRSVIRFAL